MPEVQGAPPRAANPGENPPIGVAGFVCSLVGLFIPGLGLIGLILSIVGYRRAKRYGMAKGLSTAGIVLGIITTFTGILLILFLLLGFWAAGSSSMAVVVF
jgi:small-conductance mechanosensitive channel